MFKWFGIVVGVIVIAITTLFVGARFSDGPMAMLPGGAFQSGKTLDYPANWEFASELGEIELETSGSSRTVWVAVVGQKAYIPASLSFPPFKTWHMKVLDQPLGKVRIGENIYPVELELVEPDSPEFGQTLTVLAAKYPNRPPSTEQEGPGVMIFQLAEPRPEVQQ